MSRLIFITGGVVSSLGKGIVASSIANILQNYGFNVNIKKLDPYLNIDPGTMNPIQHGEVFVTNDGGETDLDLGHYERFTGKRMSKNNSITAGRIYEKLLQKERNGDYLGKTVQVVPHVTDLIKEFILKDFEGYDFTICEIGGTVGDIEGQAFLESIRQVQFELTKVKSMHIHVTLLPYIAASQELKTKPTQNSVKDLMSFGILADALVCRTSIPLEQSDRKKIASFCNVKFENVIEAPDVDNIYKAPIVYKENGIGGAVLSHFDMFANGELFKSNESKWLDFIKKSDSVKDDLKIGIVGKYTASSDAYKSLIEAIKHAAIFLNKKASIIFIDSISMLENQAKANEVLHELDAVIVAGGFGTEGMLGKLEAIKYCRQNNKRMLGICLGMQLSVIEFARNVCGLNVTSAEFGTLANDFQNAEFIVNTMQKWELDSGEIVYKQDQLGGSMRLGSQVSMVKDKTLARKIYNVDKISERHRHRYEVDVAYADKLAKFGGIFSGLSPDGGLPEIFEISSYIDAQTKEKINLDFFVSCQYHPEFNSDPLNPNKIFIALLQG